MDAETLTRRAELARAIEGQTVCGLLELAARRFAGRPALSEPAGPGDAAQPKRNRAGAEAEQTRWVSYLSLAHIAERMFSVYLAIGCAGHVYFCRDAAALAAAAGVVQPTGFFGVPRVWEKIAAAIQAGLAAEPDRSAARPSRGPGRSAVT